MILVGRHQTNASATKASTINSKLEYYNGEYLKGEYHAEEYYREQRRVLQRGVLQTSGDHSKCEDYRDENYILARECFRRTACLCPQDVIPLLTPVSRPVMSSERGPETNVVSRPKMSGDWCL